MTDQNNASLRQLRSCSLVPSRPWQAKPVRDVLGTVWTTGQADLATQLRQRGYRPETARTDPAVMPPAIAAHAIAAFTRPGDLVLDPDCGAGTTLVEALHAGCHTIGLASTHRTRQLARANVSAVKTAGAPMDGMVLVLGRRPNTLATAHAAGFTGRVDLILTTLRPPAVNRGPHTVDAALSRLRVLLADCRALLRPDGHVVITSAPHRDPGQPNELVDMPGQIAATASAAGLVPLARCVALTGALHSDHVRPWQRPRNRHGVRGGSMSSRYSAAEIVHHTVLVFGVAPSTAVLAATMPSVSSVRAERCRAQTRAQAGRAIPADLASAS